MQLFSTSTKDTNMRNLPKALVLAGITTAALASPLAVAQTPAPAAPAAAAPAEEASPLTTKISIYSEYEYRGISQTSENPALQLNIDYAHPSGFYLGTFVSNISWLKDTAAASGIKSDAYIEWDLFGGFKYEVMKDVTLDVGYLHYEYPSSSAFNPKPNTDEVYLGATYGPATLKYSYSFNDTFGVPNSKGSDYLELNVGYPIIEKVTLNGTLGHQRYKGTQSSGFSNGDLSYTVWKLGATYDFGNGWNAGAYYKGTNADAALYTVQGTNWAADRLVAFVAYAF
jgi:uncharacterized protein (TIGR02001 family)